MWWDEARLSVLEQGRLRKWLDQQVRQSSGRVLTRRDMFTELGAPARLSFEPAPTRKWGATPTKWEWCGYWTDDSGEFGYDIATLLVKAADPGIVRHENTERHEKWKQTRAAEKAREARMSPAW